MSGNFFGRFKNVRLIGETAFSFLDSNLSLGALQAHKPESRRADSRMRSSKCDDASMERKTFEKKQIVSSTLKHQSIETAVFQASGFADWMGNHGSPNPSSGENIGMLS